MVLSETSETGNLPHPPSSAARLRRRPLSAEGVLADGAQAAKTAALAGFLSNTCLASNQAPPTATAAPLQGSSTKTSEDLFVAAGCRGLANVASSSFGETAHQPANRKRKGDATATAPAAQQPVDCLLTTALSCNGLSALSNSAACEGEAGGSVGEPMDVVLVSAESATPQGSRNTEFSPSSKPAKRAPPATPRLLRLPLLGPHTTSCRGGGLKSQLLSPACRLRDVTASPLSVVSQASTTCALLSSASSLASCSQPATPVYSLLDAASPSPGPSAPYSPLPLTPPPQSPPAIAQDTPAPTTAKTCEASPKVGPPQGPRLRMRGACNYEGQVYGELATHSEHPTSDLAASSAASISGHPAAAATGPAVPPKTLETSFSPSDDSTVGTSFLSSPKATAAASSSPPLRLPIPTRGLRRLQNPRQQQQAAATTSAAEETECNHSSNQQPHRSLRRLQLPRLRAPVSASSCLLTSRRSSQDECKLVGKFSGAPLASARDASERMYSPSNGSFPSSCAAGCPECVSCGGSCSHDDVEAPQGPSRGKTFEAAAHAAHVAAHAAARAAAHAAARAAVLKRRAAEAYWCSRPVSHSHFSVYPDLDRDIHCDYNLYCAAWPDAGSSPEPSNTTQETTSTASVNSPSPETGGDLKCRKGGHGHFLLGEGRYGKVVLAEHKRTHELVAVKMLDKRRALSDDAWDCRQELEMHRRLPHHAHVVSVLDVYEDRKSLYILMELCDRNTLVDRIVSDGAFTEEKAKMIFAQLAPEVLAGNYYDGFLSDVWSLGVILYIIISATPPFYGESDGEVVQKIVAGSYSISGYQWRHVSEECKDIIRRLMTVDPRCRMNLNEAISHPWFIRATTGMGWSLPSYACARCSVEDAPYNGVDEEGQVEEDFGGSCCCGGCHADHCDSPVLPWNLPCHFACCRSSSNSELWVPRN